MTFIHFRQVAFLSLDIYEEFRFRPDGPIYRRVIGRDERAWIEDVTGKTPRAVVDYAGCYVFLVSDELEGEA